MAPANSPKHRQDDCELQYLARTSEDTHMEVRYTDVDYLVFSDAASLMASGQSPYKRTTYRYSPLIAFLLFPNSIIHRSWEKFLFSVSDLLVGLFICNILKLRGVPENLSTLSVMIWLFNPFTFTIGTRGNCEPIVCAMVLWIIICLMNDERSLRNPLGVDRDATKRQKLENGYLCKVAHLKHQSLLSHKLPKVRQVDPNTVNSRLKVTVPREPDLETAHRAQKHRSRNNSESGEHAKSKGPTFKARPLNRKILKAPSLLPQIKSRPQSPVFQEFHLKTSKRAMQHSSANDNSESISKNEATHTERLNCEEASKQEKCKTLKRVKFLPHNKKIVSSKKDVCTFQNVKEEAKELKLLNDDGLSYNPPIELFNKLSLKSELEHNAISPSKLPLHTKGSKENIPGSLKQVVQRYGRKLSHCGSKWMIPEIGPQPNIYRRRSMNIR